MATRHVKKKGGGFNISFSLTENCYPGMKIRQTFPRAWRCKPHIAGRIHDRSWWQQLARKIPPSGMYCRRTDEKLTTGQLGHEIRLSRSMTLLLLQNWRHSWLATKHLHLHNLTDVSVSLHDTSNSVYTPSFCQGCPQLKYVATAADWREGEIKEHWRRIYV
jgi:hypothetical protein